MAINSTYQTIFAAIASFIFITLIFSFIYLICKTIKKRRHDPEARHRTRPIRSAPNLANSTSFISIAESQLFDPSLIRIDMSDLVSATRNFSPDLIVGDGSFGLVYKANLPSGVTVAVKKLDPDAFQGYREFKAEMETLGKIRHDNIVNFSGYCISGLDRILIYEFVEKGSLDQWLYDTSSYDNDTSALRVPLSWRNRINIILGVAKGLAYMHNLDVPIIHRDIKASNVLLDANYEAHIADFGLARRVDSDHSHVSTQVAGTMGYMPPEYINGATLATVMGDVYSFGILMFEIATSRRPNLPLKGDDGKEIRLVQWATNLVCKNREMEMVDARLSKQELKESHVVDFFKIATFCTTERPKLRPSMNEVVTLLNQIQDEVTS
ncbi:leucine-rich repeat receptor protein kinase EMS1 [Rutidosis leptorrhynchoides]|uniref:leucine-rich repeat receptor protein kinase EMS1 n=1 Tax=Rutidosis leptorrhynchoides TaxID=125765 RepID=UPI003A997660